MRAKSYTHTHIACHVMIIIIMSDQERVSSFANIFGGRKGGRIKSGESEEKKGQSQ